MHKLQMQQRVLQHGKLLELGKFEWNENTRVFSTEEDRLVLNFNDMNYITFITGSDCTFNTGSSCVFKTSSDCTFTTGADCVIVRRGAVSEVIQPKEGQTIKLNGFFTEGYEVIEKKHEITID